MRAGIAYTFQITSVFANLSAYDNVALPVQRTLTDGRGSGSLRDGVMSALSRTGLAGRARETAGSLSYGHQRLLEVAMGLALTPCVVPHAGEPSFTLADDEIEIGIGIHGEPGRERVKLESANGLVERLLDPILEDLPYNSGERTLLFFTSTTKLKTTPFTYSYNLN